MTTPHRYVPPPGRQARPGLLFGLSALFGGLLRLAAGLLALFLMLGALLVGATLALGLVAWALVRGRRPQAQVFSTSFQRMRKGRRGAGPQRQSGAGQGADAAVDAVVDIEVREVPDDGRPTTTLRPGR